MSTRPKTWSRRALVVAALTGVAAMGFEVILAASAEPQPALVDKGPIPD